MLLSKHGLTADRYRGFHRIRRGVYHRDHTVVLSNQLLDRFAIGTYYHTGWINVGSQRNGRDDTVYRNSGFCGQDGWLVLERIPGSRVDQTTRPAKRTTRQRRIILILPSGSRSSGKNLAASFCPRLPPAVTPRRRSSRRLGHRRRSGVRFLRPLG